MPSDQTVSASHPCDACEGSGAVGCASCRITADLDVLAAFGLCATCADLEADGYDVGRLATTPPCPVCLGAGSFPDCMPARDALADAETLRAYVSAAMSNQGYSTSNVGRASRWTWTGMEYWRSRGEYPDEFLAAAMIRKAAHAAFRACPGLRGERGRR